MINAGAFTIPADHPALPGHFPGNPVVPGVILLDHATTAILTAHPGHRLAALPHIKFLRPVRPGDTVTIAYAATPPRIAFACHVGPDEILRGTLLLE
jgi:3-hydroxymyristoyl/3-hydroxydecanoyl-(acyl carrier protein) dehydratase